MLFKFWDMYMNVLMNIAVYESAYIWLLSYAWETGWTRKKLNLDLYKKYKCKIC